METPSTAANSPPPAAAPHVLVFPFPALGHMIPLLDLSHLLSLRGISITVLVTPKNLPFLSPFLSPNLKSLVLPFPSSASFPADAENLRDLPSGGGASAAMSHALSALRRPILQWATSHASPPAAIISDFFLGWTQSLAGELKIPRLAFFSSGALLTSVMDHLWLGCYVQNPNYPIISFPDLPGSPSFPFAHLPSLFRLYQKGQPEKDFMKESMLANSSSWGIVLNTFHELEGLYIEHLMREYGHRRIWAIGPAISGGRSPPPSLTSVTSWLDSRPEASVVYICFGSQFEASEAQRAAIEAALEKSGASFVWCVKSMREKVAAEGKGIVIEGWAPQLQILQHPAVGSFLTHCGWNSVLEGMAAGAELLAWLMEADQFVNAKLLVEEASAAVRVGEGAELVDGVEELAAAFAASVAPARERKAAEMKRAAAAAVNGEGGTSSVDLGNLIKALKELIEDDNLEGHN